MQNLVIENGKLVSANATGDVTVPEGVTEIGRRAFASCNKITSVTLPEGLTKIGDSAFYYCDKLVTVNIPESVRSIGKMAFYYCKSLAAVTLPEGLEKIPRDCFTGCYALGEVRIPDSLTELGDSAFYCCSGLKSVTLGRSLTRIGKSAFHYAHDVERVEVPSLEFWLTAGHSCVSPREFELIVGGEPLTELVIPEGVTEIPDSAFRGVKSLKSVTLADSVTRVGRGAFENCRNLERVSFGKGIAELGGLAFDGCRKLKTVDIRDLAAYCRLDIPTGFPTDGHPMAYAERVTLNGKPLTHVTVPAEVGIMRSGFRGCDAIEAVTLSEGITGIGERAFSGCYGLKSVTLPESLVWISSGAFGYCRSLIELHIPRGVKSIGEGIIKCCKSLAVLGVHDNLAGIEDLDTEDCGEFTYRIDIDNLAAYAENGKITLGHPTEIYIGGERVTELRIPDGVRKIHAYAFRDCQSLERVYIPDSVEEIEAYAFLGCTSLAEVRLPEGAEVAKTAFEDTKLPDSEEDKKRMTLCYRMTEEDTPEAVRIGGVGSFVLTEATESEMAATRAATAIYKWQMHYSAYTDRCGSDYEFCYDDDSVSYTTVERLFGDNCLVKDGEVIGFIHDGVALLISSPRREFTAEDRVAKFHTDVVNRTYTLVKR